MKRKFFNLSGNDDVGRRGVLVILVMLFHAVTYGTNVVDARTPWKTNNDIPAGKHLVRAHNYIIQTIESADGDIIDCIDIYRQPAFDQYRPSLRNHTIQMQPSSYPTGLIKSASFRHSKMVLQRFKSCPQGTVAILRTKPLDAAGSAQYSIVKKGRRRPHLKNMTSDPIYNGHEHSIFYLANGKFHGAEAYLNVWNPVLEDQKSEFSLGQIWLLSGQLDAGNLNSVEAGWMVHPKLFGDNKTRLFAFWTNSSYITGCYNLHCPGFIQTSPRVALGAALSPVSTYQGDQYVMNLQIFKDTRSGNWWLMFQGLAVGYWPSSLFTGLRDAATVIEWGGEVFDTKGDGVHTATQMGSGHFAGEGYKKASFFSKLLYVDGKDVLRSPHALRSVVEAPKCYNIGRGRDDPDTNLGFYFFFGGPGRSHDCP